MKKVLLVIMSIILMLSLSSCKNSDYKKAVDLFESGQYEDAKVIFLDLNGYNDSQSYISRIEKAQYDEAVELFNDRNYDEALTAFQKIPSYLDSTKYITFITNPERAIEEACAADSSAYKNHIGFLQAFFGSNSVTVYDTRNYDIRYDVGTGKFVCVKSSPYRLTTNNKNRSWVYDEGYIGHFEDANVIIDEQIYIAYYEEQERSYQKELNDFWTTHWHE